MSPPAPASTDVPAPTRERLLDAAAAVFARAGLKAATTREIARAAGINEVTLFRLFQSKGNLLAAVLDRVFSLPGSIGSVGLEAPAAPGQLPAILREFAEAYSARLNRNLPLIRVLIGEIQHFQEHELKVLQAIFRPERQQLIDRLRVARRLGRVRRDADPVIIADQISALVFMGALRSALPLPRQYDSERYLDQGIATLVRGIGVSTRRAGPRPRQTR